MSFSVWCDSASNAPLHWLACDYCWFMLQICKLLSAESCSHDTHHLYVCGFVLWMDFLYIISSPTVCYLFYIYGLVGVTCSSVRLVNFHFQTVYKLYHIHQSALPTRMYLPNVWFVDSVKTSISDIVPCCSLCCIRCYCYFKSYIHVANFLMDAWIAIYFMDFSMLSTILITVSGC